MNTERIVRISLFVALASVVHFFEQFIIITPIPGFKLGLSNIIGVFILFYYGYKDYLSVTFIRVLLVSILFQGFGTGFLLSLSGAICATVSTLFLYFLTRCSIFSCSAVGAIFHAVGQICIYVALTQTPYLFVYLPILALLSMISGFMLAILARMLIARLPKYKDLSKIRRKR